MQCGKRCMPKAMVSTQKRLLTITNVHILEKRWSCNIGGKSLLSTGRIEKYLRRRWNVCSKSQSTTLLTLHTFAACLMFGYLTMPILYQPIIWFNLFWGLCPTLEREEPRLWLVEVDGNKNFEGRSMSRYPNLQTLAQILAVIVIYLQHESRKGWRFWWKRHMTMRCIRMVRSYSTELELCYLEIC